MPSSDHGRPPHHPAVNRRTFLKRVGGGLGAAALVAGARGRPASAQSPSSYPDWIAPSPKPAETWRDYGAGFGVGPTRHRPPADPVDRARSSSPASSVTGSCAIGSRTRPPAPTISPWSGDLAESWEAQPGHRVWTFKLRQGVKWQNVAPLNGRELVAADVKYCYEGYAKEGRAVVYLPRDRGRSRRPTNTHCASISTRPTCFFAHNLAEPVAVIFPREVLEEDGDLKKRMIGTGPYLLKEHTRKVRIVLARNPDYWDKGRPYVDEYTILSTPDAATRLAAFRSGQSDILWVASPSELETVRKSTPTAAVQAYANSLAPFGLALAQDKPPFNDLRVRRALSMAIDRQKQVDTVFEGHGIPGWGVPFVYYQDKPPTLAQLGPWVQYRPAEAKKLMTEAGHPNGFDTTLFYYEYFPQMTSQVQLVQQDLKKNLNINMKITKLDYTGYYGRYVESKWDGMAWGFQSGHAVGLDERTYHYLHSKSTKNFFRVNDAVLDELTLKLRQTPDRAEQRVVTRKIVEREFDQVLRMWMPYDNGFILFQPHLRNMAAGALRRSDGYGSPTLARTWFDK